MKQPMLLVFIALFALSMPFNEQIIFAAQSSKQPIRGIYVKAANANGSNFLNLLSLVKQSDLNAMVIDIKDDNGLLTFLPAKNSLYYSASKPIISNPHKLMRTLKKNHIYPIARIVTFKDSHLANKKPNLSFRTNKAVWKNSKGDSFTNPFLKEVWDYNIGIGIEAAKLGFKEIQFDYVRFPERFETFEHTLSYQKETYHHKRSRVAAISGFVEYARKKLKPYHVKLAVDTFGNTTVMNEADGIGQNFSEISQNVDVISAMIYPSHWKKIFGIEKPDLHPFQLVKEYAKLEKKRFASLKHPPTSRPWIQDFTAVWMGHGNYKVYGKREIEDQIRALHSEGIDEFLLWNSKNSYTQGVDYTPY